MSSLEWIECGESDALYAESEAFSRYWIHDNGDGIVLEFMTCDKAGANWVTLGDHYKTVPAAKRIATMTEKKQ